jgi:hypothetical protein
MQNAKLTATKEETATPKGKRRFTAAAANGASALHNGKFERRSVA